jgi:hypothetical protein
MKRIILLPAALLLAQSALLAQDEVPEPRRISSVECTIIRKNACNGFSKVAKGRFFYDAAAGAAAYEYGAPFGFRFIINDTAMFGIDARHGGGYTARRGEGPRGCDDLYESVHFFDAFLRCVNTDTASMIMAGQTDDHRYYARKDRYATDVLAYSRESGALDCIESFDDQGEMYRQIKARYDEQGRVYDFPVRIVIRKRCSGVLTSDTVLISRALVNKGVSGNAFTLPAGRSLRAMGDVRQGLFSPK